MKKDKIRLLLIVILTITLLIGILIYAKMAIYLNKINLGTLIPIVIPLLIIIFMIFFITRRYRDIQQGMPMEDERSKKVMNQAAAKSFFISLYWLLFIAWFEDLWPKVFQIEKITSSQLIGLGIAGMAITFFLCWLYFNKKGKLI